MKRQSYKYLFYNCNYFLHTLTFYIVATFFSKLFFWSEFFFPNFVTIIDHLLLLNTFLHVGLSRARFFFGLVRLVLVQGKSILFGSVYFVKIFMINSINLVTFWVEWLDWKLKLVMTKRLASFFFVKIKGLHPWILTWITHNGYLLTGDGIVLLSLRIHAHNHYFSI